MKIGLVSVDSKIPNLALMKLSAYHKKNGDAVEVLKIGADYDKVYGSKVFKFTPDFKYPSNAQIIKGGSGYDLIFDELHPEIENIFPDYEIFNCNYALGFFTRGCIRNCPFCIVPEKEGSIHPVGDLYSFWRPGQREVLSLDNNITALPGHLELIATQTIKEKVKIDFSQGLDIRLITPEIASLLSRIPFKRFIRFAFDDVNLENKVRAGIQHLNTAGIKSYRLMFYVLIGFNSTPEEDLYRVEMLRGLGCDIFVMPYNRKDPYQSDFARWVNMKATFKTVKWEDYRRRGA